MEAWEPTGHRRGNLQEMLDGLQADYTKGAGVKFPGLGWEVYVQATGPDLYRARLVNTERTVLADETFTAQALGAYISATLILEERRATVLAAAVLAEAEGLLK